MIDRSSTFISKEFINFCTENDIENIQTTIGVPQKEGVRYISDTTINTAKKYL